MGWPCFEPSVSRSRRFRGRCVHAKAGFIWCVVGSGSCICAIPALQSVEQAHWRTECVLQVVYSVHFDKLKKGAYIHAVSGTLLLNWLNWASSCRICCVAQCQCASLLFMTPENIMAFLGFPWCVLRFLAFFRTQ